MTVDKAFYRHYLEMLLTLNRIQALTPWQMSMLLWRAKIFHIQVLYPELLPDWTKSEAFDIMDMDKEVYKNSFQYQASFMAFRKSMRSIMFVEEWLNNCCNPDLINPAQNIGKQIETFQNHRMDQSCFSLLCKKYNVSPHKDPTQFGIWGYPEVRGARYVGVKMKNEYPIVIVLHRLKDFGLRNKLRLVKRTMCLISKNIIKNIRRKRC